jgi:cytochrome c oxidase assembly protein subunit 11
MTRPSRKKGKTALDPRLGGGGPVPRLFHALLVGHQVNPALQASADNRRVLAQAAAVAGLMFGFGYAMVPLYQKFCESPASTTCSTRRREVRNTQVDSSRTITVEFDANLHGLPWRFRSPGRPASRCIRASWCTCLSRQQHAQPPGDSGRRSPATARNWPPRTSRSWSASASRGRRWDRAKSREMPVVFVIDPALPKTSIRSPCPIPSSRWRARLPSQRRNRAGRAHECGYSDGYAQGQRRSVDEHGAVGAVRRTRHTGRTRTMLRACAHPDNRRRHYRGVVVHSCWRSCNFVHSVIAASKVKNTNDLEEVMNQQASRYFVPQPSHYPLVGSCACSCWHRAPC